MKLYGTHRKYKIFLASNKDRHFYCQMGRFFSNYEIIKELEGPIYDADSYQWLLAKDGLEIIAFSSCRDAGNGTWWFNQTWVNPEHRHKGIYRKLFQLKTILCIENGAKVLKGTALTDSKALFEENGWTVTSIRGPRWTWFEKIVEGGEK